MSNERKQILQMLADSKINTDDAERLLDALNQNQADQSVQSSSTKKPKFLYVQVDGNKGSKHENVNIKIPIMLLKAGMKLGSLVPDSAREKFSSHLNDKGIDFDLTKLDSEKIDMLIQALTESSIDVDADDEKVRIYCA